MIKGLQLSEMFYLNYGKNMIKKKLPQLENRIAIGLVGEGSECFGLDDEISKDHDYGPSFCMWVTDDDFDNYYESLKIAFESLPNLFNGMKTRLTPTETIGRTGVLKTSQFYKSLLSVDSFPKSNLDWLKIKEVNLATAVNGKVFRDDLGDFSKIRQTLINYYPQDVWYKRLAAALALMAQSGQYNYIRCVRRGDFGGAFLMMSTFIQNCVKVIFLLNRQYRPFDKWAFKKMDYLPELKVVQSKLKKLLVEVSSEYDRILLIESICAEIASKLETEGLSTAKDDFLMTHAIEVTHKIKDENLLKINMLSDEI